MQYVVIQLLSNHACDHFFLKKSEKHQSQMSENMFKRINTPRKHSEIVDQKILRPSEAKLQRMVIFKGALSIIYNYLHSSLFWT